MSIIFAKGWNTIREQGPQFFRRCFWHCWTVDEEDIFSIGTLVLIYKPCDHLKCEYHITLLYLYNVRIFLMLFTKNKIYPSNKINGLNEPIRQEVLSGQYWAFLTKCFFHSLRLCKQVLFKVYCLHLQPLSNSLLFYTTLYKWVHLLTPDASEQRKEDLRY